VDGTWLELRDIEIFLVLAEELQFGRTAQRRMSRMPGVRHEQW